MNGLFLCRGQVLEEPGTGRQDGGRDRWDGALPRSPARDASEPCGERSPAWLQRRGRNRTVGTGRVCAWGSGRPRMQARGLWVVRKPQGKTRSLSVSPQRPQNSRTSRGGWLQACRRES